MSADGTAGTNANLALKGVLGIRAMAELASIKGEKTTSEKYLVCLAFMAIHFLPKS